PYLVLLMRSSLFACFIFFFNATSPTEIYTLSLHDALPILLAPTVLGHWGIASTEDLGRIVFTLIDVGLLASQPTDKPADFERVYDFAEVFRADYPWPGVERG